MRDLRSARRGPRKTVATLIVVACLIGPLAVGAYWLRNEVLDTSSYVKTVTPLSTNTAIDAAVSTQVTDALVEEVQKGTSFTVTPAVRAEAERRVEAFLQTETFQKLWAAANAQAHEGLIAALDGKPSPFIGEDGSVAIDLSNIIAAARQSLIVAGVNLADVPQSSDSSRRFVIAKAGVLQRVRRGVSVLRVLAIALPLLVAVLLLLALLISRERKRTLGFIGVAAAVAGVAGLGAIVALRSAFLDVVGPDFPHDAAVAFYDTLLSSLRAELKVACFAGLALAAVAALLGLAFGVIRGRPAAL